MEFKLKETGRMAIIHNGSALFSGDAGSGESKIRQYVIENDWLKPLYNYQQTYFIIQGFQHMYGSLQNTKPNIVKEKYN